MKLQPRHGAVKNLALGFLQVGGFLVAGILLCIVVTNHDSDDNDEDYMEENSNVEAAGTCDEYTAAVADSDMCVDHEKRMRHVEVNLRKMELALARGANTRAAGLP